MLRELNHSTWGWATWPVGPRWTRTSITQASRSVLSGEISRHAGANWQRSTWELGWRRLVDSRASPLAVREMTRRCWATIQLMLFSWQLTSTRPAIFIGTRLGSN